MTKLNWLVGTIALYACSFQDFDYLHDNHGSAGKGNASGGAAISNGGSTDTGSGGSSATVRGGTSSTSASGGEGGAGDTAGAGGDEHGNSGGAPNGGGEASGGKALASGGAQTTGGGKDGAGGGSAGNASGGKGGTGAGGTTGNPMLVNPSFESSLTGWTIDPPEDGPSGKRYIYTQAPTDSSKPPDGSQELATWHDTDSYEVSIFQTLHGLQDGSYSFSGYFSSDRSGGTYMFARNCGSPDREEQVPTTTWSWFTHELSNIQVSGGSCEVGLRIVAAPNDYLNADMFTFQLNPEGGAGGAGGAGSAGGGGAAE